MIEIAIILNRGRWNARLCRIFTGCYAYHAAFVDRARGHMYDMNLIRRRRPWPYYSGDGTVEVELYPAPRVAVEYLEERLTFDESHYGFVDYSLFGIRGIYHLFGRPTRNASGMICSEMVNNDLRANGVATPWSESDPPPSPCDLRAWLRKISSSG